MASDNTGPEAIQGGSPTSEGENETWCVICKNKIPYRAIKCTICDSYQDRWRRIFLGGQLASLAGLIPILVFLGGFGSYAISQFKPVGSDVTVFEPDCRSSAALSFTASNLGNRDAVVSPVSLEVFKAGKIDGKPIRLRIMDSEVTGSVLLKSGAITQFKVAPYDGGAFLTDSSEQCKYRVKLSLLEFNADSVDDDKECRCAKD
jgi:hypothetical protein